MLNFNIVIPARFASTRLPGKPLLDLGGKPMVIRVAEQAARCGAQQVLIATDHQPIMQVAHTHGVAACMTKADHPSGTDRIAEVAMQQGWGEDVIVVNVQGDEPLIPPVLIRAVAQHLHDHPDCAMATACHPLHDTASMHNPNIVKVVRAKNGNALYFSRAPIPYPRDAFATASAQPDTHGSGGNRLPENVPVLRHIGIYAYRVRFLKIYGELTPAAIEQTESLEQLRALWHGYPIGVTLTDEAPPNGVDTPQDLLAVREFFNQKPNGGEQK